MRVKHRVFFIVWACLVSGAGQAQENAVCKEIEIELGLRPLEMLETLDHRDCLGGARDTSSVTLAVIRLVPDAPEREPLAEAPGIARAAVDHVATYVNTAMPEVGQSARELLAELANGIEAVSNRLTQNQLLGDLDAKGWLWTNRRLPGLPALQITRLDVTCTREANIACREAASAGMVMFRAVKLMNRALRFSRGATYQQALDAARVRDAKWTRYFDGARLQYPWELYLNGQRHARENRKAGGFADVPDDQWIVLHPGVGLEYVKGAPRGSRFEPALVVELVGYNRWRWKPDGTMGTAYGVSLIQSYSDRVGLDSSRTGVMFHYDNRYSLALTRGGGETGVMLSIDLSNLVTRVEEDARARFRLLGTGRAEE